MTSSNSNKERSGRFVAALFNTGDKNNQSRGIWWKERGSASDLDIISFVKNEAVIEATDKYLREIHTMWIRSKLGTIPLDSRLEFPLLNASLPPNLMLPLQNKATNDMTPANLPDIQNMTSVGDVKVSSQSTLSALPPAVSSPTLPTTVPPSVGSATLNQALKPGQLLPTGSSQGKLIDTPRVIFHVPNAKVGQPYVGKLVGTDSTGKFVTIRDAIIAPATGISFDANSSELIGVPSLDGDHKVAIRWTTDNVTIFSGECILIVNPDPRTLWKNIATAAGDPYYKKDTDELLITAKDYKIVAASRRGRSHEHVGSFRDDDFFVSHEAASGWSVLIVADGAGSAKSSRWGSKLAVKAAGEHILSNLKGQFGADMTRELAGWSTDMTVASKAMSSPFYLLFQEASKLAVQAIEEEALSKGVATKEYSTTLLASVIRRDGNETFLATFWMGDGAIAAYGPTGKVRLMGTPDSGEFAGQTRFLDRAALNDQAFGKRLGLGRYSDLTAVILMTDGISDPRFETDTGLADAANWDALWGEISPLLTSQNPASSLVEWLNFFTPGHHDDRTIAVLW